MKRLLLIFIFTLSFQNFTKADDIRDFEIEGMSIGESLLNHLTEKKIKKNISDDNYSKKKFYDVNINESNNFTTYDGVQIALKNKDKKYIIHGIDGILSYNNIEQCFKKKNKIIYELVTIFKEANKFDREKIEHPSYPGTYTTDTFLTLDTGDKVVISCYDFSKSLETQGYLDQLRISLWTEELNDWLVR